MTIRSQQLTLDVLPHPVAAHREGGGYIAGTLKLTGELRVDRDLNAGDSLIVVVQDADGDILAHHEAEVGPVTLAPIEDKDLGIIGTERIHRARIGDPA